MAKSLDELLNPAFVENILSVPLAEVRTRRAACQSAETALSYVRRLIQGRLDIAAAALAAHTSDGETGLSSLVARLPEILADQSRDFSPVTRLEGITDFEQDPDLYAKPLVDELDKIAGAEGLGDGADSSEDSLRKTIDELGDLEQRVSAVRKKVHEAIDTLQEEIVRRYKTGEASVDSLLGK